MCFWRNHEILGQQKPQKPNVLFPRQELPTQAPASEQSLVRTAFEDFSVDKGNKRRCKSQNTFLILPQEVSHQVSRGWALLPTSYHCFSVTHRSSCDLTCSASFSSSIIWERLKYPPTLRSSFPKSTMQLENLSLQLRHDIATITQTLVFAQVHVER